MNQFWFRKKKKEKDTEKDFFNFDNTNDFENNDSIGNKENEDFSEESKDDTEIIDEIDKVIQDQEEKKKIDTKYDLEEDKLEKEDEENNTPDDKNDMENISENEEEKNEDERQGDIKKNIEPLENKEESNNEDKNESEDLKQSENENLQIDENQQFLQEEEKKEIQEEDTLTGVQEKTGFGWKGLGSRWILFDEKTKMYKYEVIEPELTEDENGIKDKLIRLFRVRTEIDVYTSEKNQKIDYLIQALDFLIQENNIEITEETKNKIYYYIIREFIGYGKIDILMQDEDIEDISCDGDKIPIFVYHKTYENIRSNVIYETSEELNSFVVKLSQMCGKQISVYEPVVDGKLEDGSRLQTTLAKTITKKSTFTIRRFREDPLTPIDLIQNNTMSIDMASYFWLAIEKGVSVLFCGGTASGKTTMLNALSLFLPNEYKIVTVEDTREINLPHENWIAGTTRTGFSSSEKSKTGKDIDMFDLIRVALRQRPKAIIVGEVRGVEAYSLFQAMTTGHLSYSTVHASDMHSLIQRLESPPINLPRSLLTSLDLVVFLNSLTIKGLPVRRITNVTEIIKLDPETNRLVTLSPFYWVSEIEDKFEKTSGSRILNKIKLQNMWDDNQLNEELNNRKKILNWMIENNMRSIVEVGNIVTEYNKDPESVLLKIEDSK